MGKDKGTKGVRGRTMKIVARRGGSQVGSGEGWDAPNASQNVA